MIYHNKELDFSLEVNDTNFKPITDEAKVKYFGFSTEQLKWNLFRFVEFKDGLSTGRFIDVTLDAGIYPTLESVKEGVELCKNNSLKVPGIKLLKEEYIHLVGKAEIVYVQHWQLPNLGVIAQYYIGVNSRLICIGGKIENEHDKIDDLLANIAMSAILMPVKDEWEKVHEETFRRLLNEERVSKTVAGKKEHGQLITLNGLGECRVDDTTGTLCKTSKIEVDGFRIDVRFACLLNQTLTEEQVDSYIFAMPKLENLFKEAKNEIEEEYGKDVLNSVEIDTLWFCRDGRFGFLGEWDEDEDHGLGIEYTINGPTVKIDIAGQYILI